MWAPQARTTRPPRSAPWQPPRRGPAPPAPPRPPRHPIAMARFGLSGIRPARSLLRSRFEGERARALVAGCCAHSMVSLRTPASAAFGIVLVMGAHAVGWPVARGGSQRLTEAPMAELRAHGGEVATRRPVE